MFLRFLLSKIYCLIFPYNVISNCSCSDGYSVMSDIFYIFSRRLSQEYVWWVSFVAEKYISKTFSHKGHMNVHLNEPSYNFITLYGAIRWSFVYNLDSIRLVVSVINSRHSFIFPYIGMFNQVIMDFLSAQIHKHRTRQCRNDSMPHSNIF